MAHEPSNLTVRREGPSVWDKQAAANSRCHAMNVLGFLMIAGGTLLVAQSYKHQFGPAFRGRIKSMMPDRRRHDEVMKASEESFPASDPPGWTAAVGKAANAEPRV